MPNHQSSRRWIWGFAVFTAVITTLPYLLGYLNAGPDWVFTGFVFGVEDGNSYIAKMLTGTAGDWLFRSPYTTDPQNGFLAFLPYILLGKLAGGSAIHTQLVALFHFFRIAGCFLFAFATYDFCKIFLNEERWLRWAVILATFGGGLGWLTILGIQTGGYEQLPLEFYSPESFGFLGVFGLPHLAVARALLLWGLAGLLAKPVRKPLIYGLQMGLLWLLLGLMQPLTVVTSWAVAGASLVLQLLWIRLSGLDKAKIAEELAAWRNQLLTGIGMVAVSSPMVIYNFLAFQLDPFLHGWSRQNLILSPPISDYLLAYGLVLPFALLGGIRAWKSHQWVWTVPLAWVIIFPVLAYLPYPLQRRLPEGVWVAWIVLAIWGLDALRRKWKKPAMTLMASGTLSTILFYTGAIWAVSSPMEPLFQPRAKIAAYSYLSEAGTEFSNILTAYKTGNSLPAWSPMRVVVGHGPESVNLAELEPQVNAFYSSIDDGANKITFLQNRRIKYVFWGPDEKALGGWLPGKSQYLERVYSDDGYEVFEVVKTE